MCVMHSVSITLKFILMKKALLIIFCSAFSVCINAQTFVNATLDINQVKTTINSGGDLFWNLNTNTFEVPQGGGANVLFAGGMWLGGLDTNNALHLAAQTYRQSGGDFFPGPVMDSLSYSPATDAQWNTIWKINKTTIDTFLMWRANPGNFPSYVIPSVILTWPGNGNTLLGQAPQLAPYIDANSDGVYDPNSGDYPCVKGDQALFLIFNDDRFNHGSGGAKMKVEAHLMMYAYSAPGTWLDSAVFTNYKIYNRSSHAYTDMYLGQFNDFDIGAYDDDYVGCDITRHIAYGYNGDVNDGSSPTPTVGTYGANPPAEGLVFLNGPVADIGDLVDNDRDGIVDEPGETCLMGHHVVYNNDFTNIGNPQITVDYYGYLSGFWTDGSPWTYGGNGYGGSLLMDFMYPGDSDPWGLCTNSVPQPPWDEAIAGHSPGDRRSLASSGPFTLLPGEENCIDYAYVFGRGNNGPSSSVAAMQTAADSAHSFYAQNNPCTCDVNPLAIGEQTSSAVGIYPNPATESINIICGDNSVGSLLEILDVNGKVVKTSNVVSGNSVVINTSDLAAGVYFVRVNKGSVVLTGKFIRN